MLVTKTIFACEPRSLRRAAAAMPLSPGIAISSTNRSGSSCSASVTAERPSGTAATTSNSRDNSWTRLSNIARWSSATRTRGRPLMRIPLLQAPLPTTVAVSLARRNGRLKGVAVPPFVSHKMRTDLTHSRDHALPHRKRHELRAGFQAQLFHHPVFVKCDGSGRQVQNCPDFLHRFTFGQQLQDLALTQRELVTRSSVLDERSHDITRNQRGDVGSASKRFLNSLL